MTYLIVLLCFVGLWVSVRMQRRALAARLGLLTEPSVVQTSRARAFNVPNSSIGIVYYIAMGTGASLVAIKTIAIAMLIAAAAAAAFSVYLAYSLLFITRMPCRNCWVGHGINWLLFLAMADVNRDLFRAG